MIVFGPSMVAYSTPDQLECLSMSHGEISQSPPTFSCYLNEGGGKEYHTTLQSQNAVFAYL